MRRLGILTFAAITGVFLLTGFSGTLAFGQQTSSSPVWSPVKAAAYLDTRSTWWISWPMSASDHGTFCASCHTATPFSLGRAALRGPFFASWLGLCPHNASSGGKVLRRGTRKVVKRAATAFRIAGSTLRRSNSYLGAQRWFGFADRIVFATQPHRALARSPEVMRWSPGTCLQ